MRLTLCRSTWCKLPCVAELYAPYPVSQYLRPSLCRRTSCMSLCGAVPHVRDSVSQHLVHVTLCRKTSCMSICVAKPYARCSGIQEGHTERDLIGTSVHDKCSGLIKITTHLNHISHCKTTSSTDWSGTWTYRALIKNTCRDEIEGGGRYRFLVLRFQGFRVEGVCVGEVAISKDVFRSDCRSLTTRSSTTLSPKVNLLHASTFRALCDANLVTYRPKIEGSRNTRSP